LRYPIDGAAAVRVASNDISFEITLGSFDLAYSNLAHVLPTPGRIVTGWGVPKGIGQIGSIYMQAVPMP
jgi:hypothetical protein